MMFSRFVVFFLLYNIFYSSTNDLYNTSWCNNYTNVNGIDVHEVVAENLAYCRTYFGEDRQTNLAAFGISFIDSTGKCIGKSIHPKVLSSTYKDSIRKRMYDLDKNKILTIPDIFRGDELRFIRTSERLFDFFSFLASKRYTQPWGLTGLIKTYSEIINTDNEMNYEISMENNLSHDLLHCEQLFLYECLKDDVIISNLLNNVMRTTDPSLLYSEAKFISFDIITYNDMCPKCFASCEGNFYDLESRFNRILLEKLRICGKLEEALNKRKTSFLPLQIRISSFKPYQKSRTKGSGYSVYDYSTYSKVSNPKAGEGRGNIVQFFNPFITQFTLMNNVNQLNYWIKKDIIENACYINTNFLPNLLKEANNIEKHLLSNKILKNIINDLNNTRTAITETINNLEKNNQFKKLNNENKDNIKKAISSINDDIIKLYEIFKNK